MTFERIVAGVDGSDEAVHAALLASRLCAGRGRLLALAVAETHLAIYAGLEAAEWDRRVRESADEAIAKVELALGDDQRFETKIVRGRAAPELLAEAERIGADLMVVGSRGQGRTAGIILGSVATRVIHDARCSVLVGRGDLRPALFPRTIVVGYDGSEQAKHARAAAERIASALGAAVEPVEGVKRLHEAAKDCDLLVVGSRGLHGLPALGSVAERIAHEAPCPVLIVRGRYSE